MDGVQSHAPGFTLTAGDMPGALTIMRESAQWLRDSGRPMWSPDELTPEAMASPPESYLVLRDGAGEGAAALCLTDADPLYWPENPPGQCGYVHKLAVRRAFAGRGLARALLLDAAGLARSRGLSALCLDCDPSRAALVRLYESTGFRLSRRQFFQRPYTGGIELALYRMEL